MADIQNHIDKVFEQYSNRFRGFELLFAVVIGSGIVLLAAPLGQYYFMYIELQDNAQVTVETINEIFRSLISPAGNLTALVGKLNSSTSMISNAPQGGASNITTPIESLNSGLLNLANNLSSIRDTKDDPSIQPLINSVNSTRDSTNELIANISSQTEQLIADISSEVNPLIANISSEVNQLVRNISETGQIGGNAVIATNESSRSTEQINQSITSMVNNVSTIAEGTKQTVIVPKLMDALEQVKTSSNKINNFVESWKSLETPFGELPIGFNNLLAILPIGLAIGYVICILRLDHAIHTRERLHHLYKKHYRNEIQDKEKEITSIAPLWLDPLDGNTIKKIVQSVILVAPVILIFGLSVFLILNIWFLLEPHLILSGEAYTSNIDLLKSLLDVNSIKYNESDLQLGNLPMFFDSSGSFYKETYLNLYRFVSPFFLIFAIILYSYIKYNAPD